MYVSGSLGFFNKIANMLKLILKSNSEKNGKGFQLLHVVENLKLV